MGITWLGNLATAPSNPNDLDAYYDVVQKKSFVWSSSVWSQMTEDGWDGAFKTECYKASTIYPANPLMDGTYNGLVETPPSDWLSVPPALSSAEALYESKATWRYNGDTWEQTPWSAPIKRTSRDGATLDALPALKAVYTSTIYTNNTNKPSTPVGGSYTGDYLTESLPISWGSSATTPSNNEYIWLSTRQYAHEPVTDTWSAISWSEPTRLSGNKGELPTQGVDYFLPDGSYISYVFKVANLGSGVANIPNGDGSYNGVNEVLPTGWSDDASTVTSSQELWMTYCRYTESFGTWSTSTWRVPSKFSGAHGYTPVKGLDYFNGKDGSFTSYIFRNSIATPPEALGGTFDGTSEAYPSLWADNPSAPPNGSYTYYSQCRYINIGSVESPVWERKTIVGTVDNWSLPVQFSASSVENLVISVDSNIFAFDSVGANPSPTTITFTAVRSNISLKPTWTTVPVITISANTVETDTLTITAAEFGILSSLKVTATSNAFSDSTTIVKVSDGAKGTEGTATEIREVRFQFSADGASWHTGMLATDMYLREGTFYDNVQQGNWSVGTKITGDDGVNTFTEFWFGTITSTGNPDTTPLEWSSVQSADDVYVISRTTTDSVVGAWGAITSIRGDDGVNGKFFETRFKKGSLALGAPNAPTDYLTTDVIPTGWGANPDIALTGDEVIWAITATKNYDQTLDVNWSGTAAQWGAYTPVRGIDYTDGSSVYYSRVYKQAPNGYTAPPVANTGSWDGTTEILPNGGWADDPMTPSVGNFIYESSFLYVSTLINGVNTWQPLAGTWSTPSKYAYIPTLGTDYTNGDGSFTTYIFKNEPIGTTPAIPTGGSYDGLVETYPTGWADDLTSPLGDEITWVTHRRYVALEGVWQVPDAWVTPIKFTSTNVLVGVLDNELDSVIADFNGGNPIFDGSESGNFILYFGVKNVTADSVFSVAGGVITGAFNTLTLNGLTCSINTATGAYTLFGSNWSSDKETFTLVATHSESGGIVSKKFTLIKSKVGDIGIGGTGNRLDLAYADDVNGANANYPPNASSTGKAYVGTNVVTWTNGSTEPAISILPADYEWTLIQGTNGYSNRVDFAYGDNAGGAGNTQFPTGKLSTTYTPATALASSEYLGSNVVTWIAGNTEPSVSTSLSDYEWNRTKGNQGNSIEGARGFKHYYKTDSLLNSWSDTEALATITDTPQLNDIVTISGANDGGNPPKAWSTTKFLNHVVNNTWTTITEYIDGSLLVSGSVLADAINTNSLYALNAIITGSLTVGTGATVVKLDASSVNPISVNHNGTPMFTINTSGVAYFAGGLGSEVVGLSQLKPEVIAALQGEVGDGTGGNDTVKLTLTGTSQTSPVATIANVDSAIPVSVSINLTSFSLLGGYTYSVTLQQSSNNSTWVTKANYNGAAVSEPDSYSNLNISEEYTATVVNGAVYFRLLVSVDDSAVNGGVWLTIAQAIANSGNGITAISQANDTNISLPTDGQVLTYNGTTSTWGNTDLNVYSQPMATPLVANYSSSSSSSTRVKITLPYKVTSSKMVSFKIRIYQGYNVTDLLVSGYLYNPDGGKWHLPKVYCVAGASINVILGANANGDAYVSLTGANYTGVAVLDVVGAFISADWRNGWTITRDNLTENIDLSTTVYPPMASGTAYLKSESGGLTANNNWSGVNSFTQLTTSGNSVIGGTNTHARFGSLSGGYSAVVGSTNNTSEGNNDISYSAYFAYDMYFDDTSNLWKANRTTLGRKFLQIMGYHRNAVEWYTYNGSTSSAWKTSDMTRLMSVDTDGLHVDGQIYEANIPLSTKYLGKTANAASATKWNTARTLTLAGDLAGNVTFNGSAPMSLNAQVQNDSHTHDGRYFTETESDTRFAYKAGSSSQNFSANTLSAALVTGSSDVTWSSDKRIKVDVVKISNASDIRQGWTGYTYTKNGEKSAGLIAQDVQCNFPLGTSEINSESIGIKNADGEYIPDFLTLMLSPIIGVLVQAANEDYKYFEDRINSQQKQIDELKSLISKLVK